MKRFISVFIVLLMFLNITAISSFAEDSITVNPIIYTAEDNAFSVSGVVNHNRDRLPMTLTIQKGAEILAISEILATGRTDDGVPFEFPPVNVEQTLTSGTLSFKINVARVGYATTKTFEYFGADKRLEAMQKLEEALQAENKTLFVGYVHTYKDSLGIDIQKFDDLSDANEEITTRNLMTKRYTLPIDYSTPQNCDLIQKAIKEFNEQYKEAITLAEFFEATNISALKIWYETNKDVYSLAADVSVTPADESKMTPYFEGVLENEGFLSRKANITNVVNIKELNSAMKQQAILQTIADSNQYAVRNVLTDFSALLTSVNYNLWSTLSLTQQNNVCAQIAGNSYSTIDLFSQSVNSAILSVYGGAVIPQGSSSGGRGGKEPTVNYDMNEIAPSVMTFTDISHVQWADTAIRYLYDKGIVSGKTATTFAPDASVTRAELVKMLVLGLELKASNNRVSFNDVNANSWYAEFVSIAAENGLIKGNEKGNFNPNASITREDAATIIYRAVNPEKVSKKADFVDYKTISDYAKEAVDYMCQNGVINGIGDGYFAPKALLSRAQYAKILHLILTK